MRPPRIIIIGAFLLTTVFLAFLSIGSSHQSHPVTTSAAPPETGIKALFSFRSAFSLFPPNAIITLTQDNTTAFLARPAAFGPLLPSEGLNGQVWIGSGFGDVAAGGELGCSDVPGWGESFARIGATTSDKGNLIDVKTKSSVKSKLLTRSLSEVGSFEELRQPIAVSGKDKRVGPPIDDGTDDYLHHPLPESRVTKPNDKLSVQPTGNHADIQSIQEGAEIARKVVLLSRGGCGFFEKVKWAQRRGAIALIVGDNTKGGPLIQMYARGDTSNVTIPSIFTSYTTAHLLSSLVSPGNFIENTLDENRAPSLEVHKGRPKKNHKKIDSHPTFTPTTGITKATGAARSGSRVLPKKKGASKTDEKVQPMMTERPGWFKSLFLSSESWKSKSESSRPPSSGQLDWVKLDEWEDQDKVKSKKVSVKPSKNSESSQKSSGQKASTTTSLDNRLAPSDDFVIGVQDWRDPDLVGTVEGKETASVKKSAMNEKKKPEMTKPVGPLPIHAGKKHLGGALQEIPEYYPPLRGGSITPSSGEYTIKYFKDDKSSPLIDKDSTNSDVKSKGLLTTIFGEDEDVEFLKPKKVSDNESEDDDRTDDEHEGLWVTLTPTSGTSPFLDTLLVLVVSPLVTLTVVYSLLLIRSRFRRRRWRAPKSVVERLPVRTYQTMTSSGSQSPRLPSPTSSSSNTPLLQSTLTKSRPRSRTTTGVPKLGDVVCFKSNPLEVAVAAGALEHIRNPSESSEWKNHMGKQIECVICLEEYVDGISRVMSLPCGHEFHADCIIPWLTRRRRTCPICKGDVVRSLAQGSSNPRYEPYHDDSDDDEGIQNHTVQPANESSSAAFISANGDDLEIGITSTSRREPRRHLSSSWRTLLAVSFGSISRNPQTMQEDRNR